MRNRRNLLKILVLFIFYKTDVTEQKPSYDINTEALKLFGRDIKTVLMEFRRTHEYQTILASRVDLMMDEMWTVIEVQSMTRYQEELKKTVLEEFTATNKSRCRRFHQLFIPRGRKTIQIPYQVLRTCDSSVSGGDVTVSAVRAGKKSLDEYYSKSRELTVAETNHFRNLGFQYAGKMIHGIISAMGDGEHMYTLTENPAHTDFPTTEHDEFHIVTTSTDSTLRPSNSTVRFYSTKNRLRSRVKTSEGVEQTTNKTTTLNATKPH